MSKSTVSICRYPLFAILFASQDNLIRMPLPNYLDCGERVSMDTAMGCDKSDGGQIVIITAVPMLAMPFYPPRIRLWLIRQLFHPYGQIIKPQDRRTRPSFSTHRAAGATGSCRIGRRSGVGYSESSQRLGWPRWTSERGDKSRAFAIL
jgi:hypothetical protein